MLRTRAHHRNNFIRFCANMSNVKDFQKNSQCNRTTPVKAEWKAIKDKYRLNGTYIRKNIIDTCKKNKIKPHSVEQ